jgi:hypothetical protein
MDRCDGPLQRCVQLLLLFLLLLLVLMDRDHAVWSWQRLTHDHGTATANATAATTTTIRRWVFAFCFSQCCDYYCDEFGEIPRQWVKNVRSEDAHPLYSVCCTALMMATLPGFYAKTGSGFLFHFDGLERWQRENIITRTIAQNDD